VSERLHTGTRCDSRRPYRLVYFLMPIALWVGSCLADESALESFQVILVRGASDGRNLRPAWLFTPLIQKQASRTVPAGSVLSPPSRATACASRCPSFQVVTCSIIYFRPSLPRSGVSPRQPPQPHLRSGFVPVLPSHTLPGLHRPELHPLTTPFDLPPRPHHCLGLAP